MLASTDNFGLSYLLEWVAFVVVLWFIIAKFPGPLVAHSMAAKREQIRSQLAERDEAAAAAAALVAERKAALEVARGEAETIVAQARIGADAIVEDGRRRAEEDRARLVARAAVEIGAAHNRVRAEVIAEVGAVVVAAAEAVAAAELDDASQHRLIAEAIDATGLEAAH